MSAGADLTNRRIGDYRCTVRVSAGANGTVWKAQAKDRKEPVAIKLLNRHLAEDRNARNEFEKEFRLCNSLSHPGLLVYYEHGVFEKTPFIAMQYFHSRPMKAILDGKSRGPIQAKAESIITQVASVLDYIHHCGLVHRDIKPENILVNEAGDIKLIDFATAVKGVVKWLPFARKAVGTPSYVAPEQLMRKAASPAADMYSFGATIFEIFTGHPPFTGKNESQIINIKLKTQAPLITKFNKDITPGLDKLVATMLAREPGQRPRDMQAFMRRFSEAGIFI